MMSLPVCQGFSGPVMYVLTVGNPMTMRKSIDATRKSNAGPVVKKSVLISRQLTLEASKPHDVATLVIGTFSERLVSKHISSRIRPANPPATHSPPSVFIAVDAPPVASKKWDPKPLKGTNAGI